MFPCLNVEHFCILNIPLVPCYRYDCSQLLFDEHVYIYLYTKQTQKLLYLLGTNRYVMTVLSFIPWEVHG